MASGCFSFFGDIEIEARKGVANRLGCWCGGIDGFGFVVDWSPPEWSSGPPWFRVPRFPYAAAVRGTSGRENGLARKFGRECTVLSVSNPSQFPRTLLLSKLIHRQKSSHSWALHLPEFILPSSCSSARLSLADTGGGRRADTLEGLGNWHSTGVVGQFILVIFSYIAQYFLANLASPPKEISPPHPSQV
jgi:hypothetical protein